MPELWKDRANANAIACDLCDEFVHIKCANIDRKTYTLAVKAQANIQLVCNACCVMEMCSPDILDYKQEDISFGEEDSVIPEETSLDFLNQRGLHFIHLNARSLLPKMDEIRQFTARTKAAVIAVTETWLDSSIEDKEVELPGFYCYRRDRNRNGGGVCLFIRSDLSFIPCPEIQIETLEAAWVEIRLPKTKPIVVGVCYRPPKQNDFYELLESVCIDSNVLMERECIVLGDFNTNLLMSTKNGLLVKFLHYCKVLGLEQLIMEPTRIDGYSKSILDLVLVTDRNNISCSGVLDIGIIIKLFSVLAEF